MQSADKSLLKLAKPVLMPNTADRLRKPGELSKTGLTEAETKKKDLHLPPINANRTDEDNSEELQAVLDAILPPKQSEADGKLWIQKVSSAPATRLDVINLHHKMEHLLSERQAKEFGLCPIRRELYDELFDEIIRQVTVSCAERGVLLLRIRDELRMCLCTHQSVLESAIAFGIRKALKAEESIHEADSKVQQMTKETQSATTKIETLESTLSENEKIYQEEKELMNQYFKEENERLRQANTQLQTQLFALLESDTAASLETIDHDGK